jgi:hypothetical protein
LDDIDHIVQEAAAARPLIPQFPLTYCLTGGGLVGHGEAGCAGAAVIGAGAAAAAGCGAGFLVEGFLVAGFFVARGCCGAGVSSTTTGLGPK